MAATISSRTPEGTPNSCPVCGAAFVLEPSQPFGDAPCPACGTLLWFIRTSNGVRFHEAKTAAPIGERLIEIVSENLGVSKEQVRESTSFLEDVGADSLDIVELIMELEEEFEITIPEEEAQNIKTVGDAIDYILRHRWRKK